MMQNFCQSSADSRKFNMSLPVHYFWTNLLFNFQIEGLRIVSFEIIVWNKSVDIDVLKMFKRLDTVMLVTPKCWQFSRKIDENRHQICQRPPSLHQYHTGTELTESVVPETKGAKSTISLNPTSQASLTLTVNGGFVNTNCDHVP